MTTAVDSSVLIDVFQNDARFGEASAKSLRLCLATGPVVVCDIVLAELAAAFPTTEALWEQLDVLGIGYVSMSKESACVAGQKWRDYRKHGGTRQRLIADFLIASHAHVQCDRLQTRDRGFYRTYFEDLSVVDPTA